MTTNAPLEERIGQFVALFPAYELISVRAAAELLGGDDRIAEVLHRVETGDLNSPSHSPIAGEQKPVTHHLTGGSYERPRVDPSADDAPAKVLVYRDEILYVWCTESETRAQGILGNGQPSQESVDSREAEVLTLIQKHWAGPAQPASTGLASAHAEDLRNIGSAETPLSTRRERSLLTIIAALCRKAGIDHKARGAAAQIAAATEEIGAPVGEDTVSKTIKTIDAAVEARSR